MTEPIFMAKLMVESDELDQARLEEDLDRLGWGHGQVMSVSVKPVSRTRECSCGSEWYRLVELPSQSLITDHGVLMSTPTEPLVTAHDDGTLAGYSGALVCCDCGERHPATVFDGGYVEGYEPPDEE